jgi:hypothetical protein
MEGILGAPGCKAESFDIGTLLSRNKSLMDAISSVLEESDTTELMEIEERRPRSDSEPVARRHLRSMKKSELSYKDRWRIWRGGKLSEGMSCEGRRKKLAKLMKENWRLRKKFEKRRLEVYSKHRDAEVLRNALEASNQTIWLWCEES